jgi:ribonuclease D
VGQEKNQSCGDRVEYQLIENSDELTEFINKAGQAQTIAVDIEGDSMFHFQEKVCLIQMAANGHIAVIDTLAVTDLSGLKPLFASPSICKVIHGADYDVRSLYRDFGIEIQNLFDTQLASMYIGWQETSLEAVVARCFDVELDKRCQKKNWSQRPLPGDMATYAASDVIHLIPLAKALTDELDRCGRLEWVREECQLLSKVRPSENNDAPLFMKFKGAGRLQPRQLAALETLLQLRQAIARQKDRPLFKIIGNATLKKIAIALPATLKDLKESRELSDKQFDMYGNAVMEALRNVHRIPEDQLLHYPRQRSPRLSSRVPPRVKLLRQWRDQKAADLGLNPALVLNRAVIKAVAVENPKDKTDLKVIEGLHRWQLETFGGEILEALRNRSQ